MLKRFDSPDSGILPMHEQLIVWLEEFPWCALYRIATGYLLLLLFSMVAGKDAEDWQLFVWFLGVLVAMRFVPAIVRRVVPFSGKVRGVWTEKRQLAKQFDSYQWKKLIWIGIGMVGYLILSGPSGSWPSNLLAGFCLIGGGVGVLVWRCRTSA